MDLNARTLFHPSSGSIPAIIMVAACGTPTASLPVSEQIFLFEVEYASSWFPTWTGIAVDRDGQVIRYYRESTPWIPVDEMNVTLGELETKYAAGRSVIGQLDPDVISARFAQIARIGDDFSEVNYACADAGRLRYLAYQLIPESGRYRPKKLREEGDAPTQNRGGTALALANWLRTVLADLDVDGVRPFESYCVP